MPQSNAIIMTAIGSSRHMLLRAKKPQRSKERLGQEWQLVGGGSVGKLPKAITPSFLKKFPGIFASVCHATASAHAIYCCLNAQINLCARNFSQVHCEHYCQHSPAQRHRWRPWYFACQNASSNLSYFFQSIVVQQFHICKVGVHAKASLCRRLD